MGWKSGRGIVNLGLFWGLTELKPRCQLLHSGVDGSLEPASKVIHVVGRTISCSCSTNSTVLMSDRGLPYSLNCFLTAFAYGPVHLRALKNTQNPSQTCNLSDLPIYCISFASLFWCICLLLQVDQVLCFKILCYRIRATLTTLYNFPILKLYLQSPFCLLI